MCDGNSVPTAKNAERGTDGVPVFSLDELNRCRGQSLGGGELGVAYAIDGFPGLAVKEIAIEAHEGKFVELAERGLEAIPRLSHPGVLKYHQVIRDNHSIYIIMDRYHEDLKEFIANHTRNHTLISKELILSIARQLADALAYLHDPTKVDSCGTSLPAIVHRNLKPANVLMNEDGNKIALADFGLCKDALRSGATLAGTRPYMAPEALLYNSTSPASDIWSLGVIIYELATLKRPNFLGDKEPRHVFVGGWRPHLDAIKDDFIRSILEEIFILDPKKRQTAKELAELLQKLDIPPIELKAPTNVLDERCKSLEATLNGVNARLELLESSLRAKTDEIDSLREALANKSAEIGTLESIIAAQTDEMGALIKGIDARFAKIGALEQQFTRAIEGLRGAWHQSKLEMDQQRREAARQVKKLKKALKAANNEISSLKKEFKMRSTKIDAPEKQFADVVKNSEELNRFTPIQDSSWTPLMRAAINGSIETARRHLSDKDKKNNDGDTAYTLASQAGQGAILELLDPTDEDGETALMRAAERGDTEAVRALIPLQKGKTARYVKINGWKLCIGTALIIAAVCGHAEVVRLLVKYESGIKDEYGCTALVYAALTGHREAAELLMEHEKDVTGWTMLMCAAVLGDVEMVSQHIGERGQKDKVGWTALILGAQNGRDEAVKFLMEHEGGVSSWTSLIYAAYLGDVDAVKNNLHERGCKDVTGMTALMWAAHRGHTEVVRILVEEEGGMQNSWGWTALMFAACGGQADCIRVLLDKEGGMQNKYSWTALMLAAYNGNVGCARLLAEREKDIKIIRGCCRYPPGTTALDIAEDWGHTEIVSILRK